MDVTARARIGRTPLEVTRLGFGGGTLGDPDEITPESQADAAVEAAWDAGVRYFDTAPWYGNTKSEHRVGRGLRSRDRTEYALSTKVGRVYFRPADPEAFRDSRWMARWRGGLPFDLRFDYTRDGVLRAYEDSLMRLGLNRVDALAIHDLDLRHQRDEGGIAAALAELDAGGGFAALADLRASGEIAAIGAGVNHVGMIPRFLERFEMDYFLVAMPYTLLDQPALAEELPLCEARGASVVVGAPFASGILATGAREGATYAYRPAAPEVLAKVRAIEAVCARHAVPLAAAALQFPLAHPAVASVIPGANSPDQVRANVASASLSVPADLWAELKAERLVDPSAPVPG